MLKRHSTNGYRGADVVFLGDYSSSGGTHCHFANHATIAATPPPMARSCRVPTTLGQRKIQMQTMHRAKILNTKGFRVIGRPVLTV